LFNGEFADHPETSMKARAMREATVRAMGVIIHAMRPPLPMLAVCARDVVWYGWWGGISQVKWVDSQPVGVGSK
jgi:hypothetical protein